MSVSAPDPLVILGDDLAPGVSATRLSLPTATDPGPTEPNRSAQTLYADPQIDDTLSGRALLVGRTEESDVEGSFPLQGETVTVQGKRSRIEQRGPLWIVAWDLPLTQDCACSRQAVVAGRNLARAEVLAAAESALAADNPPTVPEDALPKGLRSLGTLPSLGRGTRWNSIDEKLNVLVGDSAVELRVVEGDPRLAVHLGFWSDGWRTFEYDGAGLATARQVGQHTVIVDQRRGAALEPMQLDALLRSLRDASRAEAEAARMAIVNRPPDEGDRCVGLGDDQSGSVFAGALDGARWALTIGGEEGMLWTCEGVDTGGSSSGAGSSTGGSGFTSRSDEMIRLVGGMTIGTGDGRLFLLVAGDVPATVADVVVTVGDRAPLHAQIGRTGPSPDRRWFATADLCDPRDVTVAVALDSSGKEIGRTQSPPH